MILIYTWLAVAITALVFYLCQLYSKLSRAGVNHLPVLPPFGNLFWVFMQKEHMVDVFMRTTTTFPNDRIVGHYDLMTPVYLVRDVEVVRQITTEHFEHFMDRREITCTSDPLIRRGLRGLQGDEWKAMRSTISPAFTSSKIRLMVPFMEEIGKEMVNVLKEKIQASGNPYIDVETKDMMTRYANDVIASCAFGLKVSSQKEDCCKFYKNSKLLTEFTLERVPKIFFRRCFSRIVQMMKISHIPREVTDYFTNILLRTMKVREKNNIQRNDLIDILAEVKREWSDTDLVAQAASFLIAGFDTVSTAMSFLLYELAVNPNVQERLVQEIREQDAKNDGHVDYDTIQDMEYLDMVVSEVLRLWPPVAAFDRRCVQDYNFGKANSRAPKDLIIRKGETVVIAPWSLHRDPKYFPHPAKFDPDRFSSENRDKIIPFTYIPFGVGPRNCIGSQFALCEIKVMIYLLLREMELYPYEKTSFPPELAKDGFNLALMGGSWVRIRGLPQK